MSANTSGVQPLIDEHQAVLVKLEALENILKNLDRKTENLAGLRELADFFNTPFWVHFEKEEQALFPEFDNFMPRGVGPLAAMIEEHRVIRDANDVLQELVGQYLGEGDTAAIRRQLHENGTHFIETLRAHIYKEDKLFTELAGLHLGAAQNTRVLQRFTEIEKLH